MKKMNLIVIKTDQQRYDALGCLGHPLVKTPHLDALAADGIICEGAHAVSTLCVPSRTSFFTGRYVKNTGAVDNSQPCHIQSGSRSLVEDFKDAGYTLGLAGKNHAFTPAYLERVFDYVQQYGHHGKEVGEINPDDQRVIDYLMTEDRFPGAENKGMGKMEGYFEEAMPFKPGECPSERITDDALSFIQDCHGQGKPFFLHYSFPEPHWPNLVCEPYHSLYPAEEIELEAQHHDWESKPFAHFVQSRAYGFHKYTAEQKRGVVAAYLAQITFIDDCIGRLLGRLRDLELYENTIIAFTSDHGDFAGRYGLVAKTKAFYDSLVRIPLIIRIPGLEQARCLKAPISNIDVMPTLAEAAGLPLGADASECIDGRSFYSLLAGTAPDAHRTELFAEVGRPEMPPEPVARENYDVFAARQERERGVFWFIDYTVNGKSLMIKKGKWKYCFYSGDWDELYNLETDPLELENLSGRHEFLEVEKGLRTHLIEWYLNQ